MDYRDNPRRRVSHHIEWTNFTPPWWTNFAPPLTLKKNQKVQLVGFGKFTVAKRAAHAGRNPRTGEAVRVKASKVVRFKAGQTLKRSV